MRKRIKRGKKILVYKNKTMKVALCFIISYEHILNKETIWREWIEENRDIINVYFFYQDIKKIKSQWILSHTIPPKFIHPTTYYSVIPAYLSLMSFASAHDKSNQWFCFLTESCCPVISPAKFKYLFEKNHDKTIMSWKRAWWNVKFHKRANLAKLPPELHLANDPWFVMKREHVTLVMNYYKNKEDVVRTICTGGVANESLFAIILFAQSKISDKDVICSPSHAADWGRMSSKTSPHLFKEGNIVDISFIKNTIKNENIMFIRKIDRHFPDEILIN